VLAVAVSSDCADDRPPGAGQVANS
jgi:hypothetical protein